MTAAMAMITFISDARVADWLSPTVLEMETS